MATQHKAAAVVVGSGVLAMSAPAAAQTTALEEPEVMSGEAISQLALQEELAELGEDGVDEVESALAEAVPGVARSSSSGSRPSVDWGYKECPARNSAIYETGITWRHGSYGNRTVFATVPSGYARYGSVPDSWTDDELWRCIPASPSPSYRVSSWRGIYDQFDCHDLSPGGIGTGPTWDLEGHRGATRNRWTWIRNTCNW